MAMAGLYEIWRDPTRDDDDPQRFSWTCTVLTTTAEDAVGHIHDRMPLLVEPERYAAWLDPSVSDRRRAHAAAGARRARPARGLPGQHAGQQRPQQRSRAARRAAPSRSPCPHDRRLGRADPARRRPAAPRPVAAPDRHAAARARRRRRAWTSADLEALAAALPRQGHLRGPRRAALAGRRQEDRARAPRCSTSASSRPPTSCGCAPRWSSAGARPGPAPPPVRRASSAPRATSPCRSRCTRPGRPERSRLDELAGGAGADARRPGGARRVRPARGVPAGPRADRRARAPTTASRCPSAGP